MQNFKDYFVPKEDKQEEKVLCMEESSASSISAANFEPDKGHSLIYLKFVIMNQPSLKNKPIQDHISDSTGCLVYGKIEDLKEYLQTLMDQIVEMAVEGAKLNP